MKIRLRSIGWLFAFFSLVLALTPILASRGGRWARWLLFKQNSSTLLMTANGSNPAQDKFFPQSGFWPYLALIYLILLAALVYLVIKKLEVGDFNRLKQILVAYLALPLLAVAVLYLSGFDYSNCHTPPHTACTNPSIILTNTMGTFLAVTIAPLVFAWWFNKKLGRSIIFKVTK